MSPLCALLGRAKTEGIRWGAGVLLGSARRRECRGASHFHVVTARRAVSIVPLCVRRLSAAAIERSVLTANPLLKSPEADLQINKARILPLSRRPHQVTKPAPPHMSHENHTLDTLFPDLRQPLGTGIPRRHLHRHHHE